MHIAGTGFVYLTEGAFGVIFVDRHFKRVIKVCKKNVAPKEHCVAVFKAEIDAYRFANECDGLRRHVPMFFGPRGGIAVFDKTKRDVSDEFNVDLAFEAEFIEGCFSKLSAYQRETLQPLFDNCGVYEIRDASGCLAADGNLKIVDFATELIRLEW